MATVFPTSEPSRPSGTEPDLMARLWAAALRTSVVSSEGVRSAVERRWRGAKGETGGTLSDWVTYRRRPVVSCWRVRGRFWRRIGLIMLVDSAFYFFLGEWKDIKK